MAPRGAAGAATYPSSLRAHTGKRVYQEDAQAMAWASATVTVARDASKIMVTAAEELTHNSCGQRTRAAHAVDLAQVGVTVQSCKAKGGTCWR